MSIYERILLKLSGESLMGDNNHGIDQKRLSEYALQIKELAEYKIETGIVIGGGNIFRGLSGITTGIDRVNGDYMGMLATVINGLAIQSALTAINIKSNVYTAINMEPVGTRFSKQKAIDSLIRGEVAIFTFGTGNPYFTTDTAATLRGIEIEADVILKGTRVDGVYNTDPEKDKNAVKYDSLTFHDALKKNLKIMDLTAFTMCQENKIPIIVFNMNKKGNLLQIVKGEKIGTRITN